MIAVEADVFQVVDVVVVDRFRSSRAELDDGST